MIWSQYLGLIYYPIPKCACTSIKTVLLQAVALPVGRVHQQLKSIKRKLTYRIEPSGITHGGRPHGLFSFAVLRHPLDRLLSCYVNKVRDQDKGLPECYRRASSFEEFINMVEADPTANEHFRPQHEILPEAPDLIIQFDNLQAGWQELQEAIKRPLPPLPHEKKTAHEPWETYYTEETKAKAESIYEGDLRLFDRH